MLDEKHTQRWQDYTASTLWMIGKRLGGDIWTLDPYTEFAYPDKVKDTRTSQQIKDDIVRWLTT